MSSSDGTINEKWSSAAMFARAFLLLIVGVFILCFPTTAIIGIPIIIGIALIIYGIALIAGGAALNQKIGRGLGIAFGIIIIIIGIVALIWQTEFFNILSYIIGIAAFAAGLYELLAGITGEKSEFAEKAQINRPVQIILGVIGIIFGILIFCWPFFTQSLAIALFGPGIELVFLLGIIALIFAALLLIGGIVIYVKEKKAKNMKPVRKPRR
ncbi:MAG TPA: DUF308 domain-containing protein [Methanocorpusculum sp.]|nr:DUF308 domain-containing protein [Methanocorpusculum sp.]